METADKPTWNPQLQPIYNPKWAPHGVTGWLIQQHYSEVSLLLSKTSGYSSQHTSVNEEKKHILTKNRLC